MKLKRWLSGLLAAVMAASMLGISAVADEPAPAPEAGVEDAAITDPPAAAEEGVTRPTISWDAPDSFVPGDSFAFTVESDLPGKLSVYLDGTNEMLAEGEWIAAYTPFEVTVDEMPDTDPARFVITVLPESANWEDPAVTGYAILEVPAEAPAFVGPLLGGGGGAWLRL